MSLPPAGWYPDPSRVAEQRYWDGHDWTDGVVVRGEVTEAPLPREGAEAAWDEVLDRRARLPGVAAVIAVGGAVVAIVLTVIALLVADALDAPRLVRFVAAQAALWAGLLGTCVLVSRRYASGRLRDDYGLRGRWSDLGRGLLLSWVARILSIIAILPLVLFDKRFVGSNTEALQRVRHDALTFAVICVFAVVGAPIVEELFFRGLLQRALESTLPVAGAIALQAALFGVAHMSAGAGPVNVTVFVATAVAGATFGWAAWHWRRLGPGIAAHGWFNLVAVVLVATR